MARKTASDGRQQIRVGTRDNNRVFKFNSSWSAKDVDRVKQQLKDVYDVCLGWNGLSSSIADNLRKGVSPVPLPDIKLGFELNRKSPLLEFTNANLKIHLGVENLLWWESQLKKHLPSINWGGLSSSGTSDELLVKIRQREMAKLQRSADSISKIDNRPATQAKATKGTLHEALKKWVVRRICG
jgi:hypothetical protein